MSKLFKYAFSDLYDISSGISSTKDQAGHGTPFASFRTVFNNIFLPDKLPDLMEVSEKEQKIYSIKKGDILITRTSETVDELAMSCVALKDYPQATYSGFVKRLRPKTEGLVYDRFMAFFLRSKYFRKVIECNTIMTLRASFNEDIFSFLDLYLPDYETQKRIGDLLYHMERKRENNAQINDNLQQMAHMTFMHCFWGKPTNGTIGEILVEHEKSPIQVGQAKNTVGSYPFFTSGDAVLRWKSSLIDGRNIFMNTGGNAGVKFYVGKAAYSTDTWCVSARDGLSDYLYLFLDSIKPELSQKFFQGTGLKHLQKPILKNRPMYIPSKDELEVFNHSVIPWLTLVSDNIRESERLAALRDWLLPMLMNGQATIED